MTLAILPSWKLINKKSSIQTARSLLTTEAMAGVATSYTNLNQSHKSSSQNSSYAEMAHQMQYPSREQAIVLDAIEGLQLQDYAEGIAKLINPIGITHISRISKNRVCLYLRTKEIAADLTDNHQTAKVGIHNLVIRSLISKTKRIIISNASADIPNSVIKNELTRRGIKVTSEISDIKAAISGPQFSHILSFRKQAYIAPEDEVKVNEIKYITVTIKNTEQWLYISTDKLVCFLCHSEGHLAKHCLNRNKEITQTIEKTLDDNTRNQDTEIGEAKDTGGEFQSPAQIAKRPRPASITSNSTTSNGKEKKKAKKTVEKPTVDILLEKLQPAKDYIETIDPAHGLDIQKIAEILQEITGAPIDKNKIERFSDYGEMLPEVLGEIYKFINCRSLKTRITKFKKKMQSPPPEDLRSDEGETTDCSQTGDEGSFGNEQDGSRQQRNSQEISVEATLPTLQSISKRALSSNSSFSATGSQKADEGEEKRPKKQSGKKPSKKMKKAETVTAQQSIADITEKLAPIKEHMEENSDQFPINFEQLARLTFETYGQPDIKSVTLKYTSELSSFVDMLDHIYPLLTNSNIKNRITRMKNRLMDIGIPIDSCGELSGSETSDYQ